MICLEKYICVVFKHPYFILELSQLSGEAYFKVIFVSSSMNHVMEIILVNSNKQIDCLVFELATICFKELRKIFVLIMI